MRRQHLPHAIPVCITLIVLAVQVLTPLAVAADALRQPAGVVAVDLWSGVIYLGTPANESRDAYFARVAAADPDRFRLPAVQAIEAYLNGTAAADESPDAFEQTFERILTGQGAAGSTPSPVWWRQQVRKTPVRRRRSGLWRHSGTKGHCR